MSSCHHLTFLSLYYFLAFLLLLLHVLLSLLDLIVTLFWLSFSSCSCPHVKSQPFLSLIFSVRLKVFFLFSCHNSTFLSPSCFLSFLPLFFLSCHTTTFLSPYSSLSSSLFLNSVLVSPCLLVFILSSSTYFLPSFPFCYSPYFFF